MEIFLLFIILSKIVLGILCLIVLEYQHQKNQKWQQTLPGPMPKQPSLRTKPISVPTPPKVLKPEPTKAVYPTPKKEEQLSMAG